MKNDNDVELPPDENGGSNVFKIETSPFDLSLRIDNFSDDKDQIKFIKSVEKMVRFSPEYKLWVNYIVETLGQDKCEFTNEAKSECSVEVHHHPICLYTVVKAVIDNYIKQHKEFCTFDIARDVIELHFQNKIGYVVMISSLHEKYHNGFMQIPIEFVNGDYKHILTNYELDKEEYDRILLLCAVHKEDIVQAWSKNNYPGLTNQNTEVKEIEHECVNLVVDKSQENNQITDDPKILDMMSLSEIDI